MYVKVLQEVFRSISESWKEQFITKNKKQKTKTKTKHPNCVSASKKAEDNLTELQEIDQAKGMRMKW